MWTGPAFRATFAQIWEVPRWAVKAVVLELDRERLAIASSSAPLAARRHGHCCARASVPEKAIGRPHSTARHYQVRCNLVKSGREFLGRRAGSL